MVGYGYYILYYTLYNVMYQYSVLYTQHGGVLAVIATRKCWQLCWISSFDWLHVLPSLTGALQCLAGGCYGNSPGACPYIPHIQVYTTLCRFLSG